MLTDAGDEHLLAPEALIGRISSASLRVEDPRISEAHALVSLRGADLRLLALRGRMSVDGKPRSEVTLTPGRRVVLAGFFGLTVAEIRLPPDVLALIPDRGHAPPMAVQGVVAIVPGASPPLRPGFDPDARAHVWLAREGVILRDGGVDRRLEATDRFDLDGRGFRLETIPRAALEVPATVEEGRFDTALAITLIFDTVRITSSDGRTATLDGLAARAVCELHAIGQPVAWQELSGLLWPEADPGDPATRQRWDQLMSRVRMKLREAGIRSDLLRANRRGLVELVVGPADRVDDRT